VAINSTAQVCLCTGLFWGTSCSVSSASSASISAIFELDNLNFAWYEDNANLFEEIFITFVSSTFGVGTGAVVIQNVYAGSIVVGFQIFTASSGDASTLSSQVSSFIQNPSTTAMTSLGKSLPSAAFVDPSKGVSIDQSGSSSRSTNATYITGGGIAGIVIAILAIFVIVAGVGFFYYRKTHPPVRKIRKSYHKPKSRPPGSRPPIPSGKAPEPGERRRRERPKPEGEQPLAKEEGEQKEEGEKKETGEKKEKETKIKFDEPEEEDKGHGEGHKKGDEIELV